MVVRNNFASVPRLNNVSLGAIFTLSTEAELFARKEVGTLGIDLVDVDYGQLIPKTRC